MTVTATKQAAPTIKHENATLRMPTFAHVPQVRRSFLLFVSGVLAVTGPALPAAATTVPATTERVSVSTSGGQANAEAGNLIGAISISGDGQLVAFETTASNLLDGIPDTNGTYDVFVRDRAATTTTLVSANSSGTPGNSYSENPAVSADGRFASFDSAATDLASAPDTNGTLDVYVRDLAGGTTSLISVNPSGHAGDSGSSSPAISATGRFVAFQSAATDLLGPGGDTNNANDVYIRDRDVDGNAIFDEPGEMATVRVSLSTSGIEADGSSFALAISGTGRFVAFASSATNLDGTDVPCPGVSGPRNCLDVFLHDRDPDSNGVFDEAGTTTQLVSVDSGGTQADGDSAGPAVDDSGDVVFWSQAENLGATPGQADDFIHLRATGVTQRLGHVISNLPTITADGRFVAYDSFVANGIVGDNNNSVDALVLDRQTGLSERISVDGSGGESEFGGVAPIISADGRFVAFASFSSDLVPGDTNGTTDVFVRDRTAGIATAPGAPTSVIGAAGDGEASVSWAGPASDGGSTITSYTVTSTPGGLTATAAGSSTSATVSGLTNGTPYAFTVTATNAVGTGSASDPSAPVTPQAGAPEPQTTSTSVPPAGGTSTTDPTNTGPTPSDPVTTSVTVPPGTAGGSLTIAETAVSQPAPSGYQSVGQQIDITSTAATSASNPLTIVFTLDSSAIRNTFALGPTDPLPAPDQVVITRTETGSPVPILTCTAGTPPIAPDPCVSDRQYVNNGDDLRITILTGSASHWNSVVQPIAVRVSDSGYSSKSVSAAQGGIVLWTFAGAKSHSVTENLKLGPAKAPLFSSGTLISGRYGYVFRAAATYTYGSTVKGDPGSFTGSVAVPVRVSPTTGGTATSFSITWSSAPLGGYVFDVQYRFMKAGTKSWSPLKAWKSGTPLVSATFSPTSGAGTYAFSSRFRNSSTGISALWSPEATIAVH